MTPQEHLRNLRGLRRNVAFLALVSFVAIFCRYSVAGTIAALSLDTFAWVVLFLEVCREIRNLRIEMAKGVSMEQ